MCNGENRFERFGRLTREKETVFMNARNLKSDWFYIGGLICTRTNLSRTATAV